MKPGITNLITEEIFAQWAAHFCRVPAAAAGTGGGKLKNMPVFQVFFGYAGYVPTWHDRC
jgi:hypothetical protein